MVTFLAVIGFLGFIAFILMAIVSKIKKTGKWKRRLLYAAGCFILMIVGGALSPDTKETTGLALKIEDTSKTKEVFVKQKTTDETKKKEEAEAAVKKKVVDEPAEKKKTEEVKKAIDTSVFAYAKSVEVTDAIDSNQHVTVFVQMAEDLKPGLAMQHVINQSYDFLQQLDISGAKTVTIAVKQGDIKIAQITVNKEAFKPDDNQPMTDVVIRASKIDSMRDDVKKIGEATGGW